MELNRPWRGNKSKKKKATIWKSQGEMRLVNNSDISWWLKCIPKKEMKEKKHCNQLDDRNNAWRAWHLCYILEKVFDRQKKGKMTF